MGARCQVTQGRSAALFLVAIVALSANAGASASCDDGSSATDNNALRTTAEVHWQSAIARRDHKEARPTYCAELQAGIKAQGQLIENLKTCRRTTALFASQRVLDRMQHAAQRWLCGFDDDDDDD